MEFRENETLGGKRVLSPPLMNGGGCVKTLADAELMSRSPAGAIVIGSMTMPSREGNSGHVWDPDRGLNSLGMPNKGEPYYRMHLPEMIALAHDRGKFVVANIAGETPHEYGELARMASEAGADMIEVNLGCPNVVTNGGGRKPIPFFEIVMLNTILGQVEQQTLPGAAISAKVSISSNPGYIPQAAFVIQRYRISAVTAVNTFASAYAVKPDGKPVIDVGYAGLSGPALKYIGLGQVKQWREALGSGIKIIAAGGIRSGEDIRDYALVGADAFQMTTELLKKGLLDPQPLERVISEYIDL